MNLIRKLTYWLSLFFYSSEKIIDLLQMNINLVKLKLGKKDCFYLNEVLDRNRVINLIIIKYYHILKYEVVDNLVL